MKTLDSKMPKYLYQNTITANLCHCMQNQQKSSTKMTKLQKLSKESSHKKPCIPIRRLTGFVLWFLNQDINLSKYWLILSSSCGGLIWFHASFQGDEYQQRIRESKGLKGKAIRQREKDMKMLWGEVSSSNIKVRKEPHMKVPEHESSRVVKPR